MLTDQRRSLIAERLRSDGQIVAKDLAAEWQLSEDTIRRDLRDMAADGLLLRVHGGALPVSPALPDYSQRLTLDLEEKQQLGAKAAAMIAPQQVVFLDGGSTTLEIVRQLPEHFTFTVATHSPTIASALEQHKSAEVILIGGRLFKHSMVSVGAVAMEAISRLRIDLYFMGATAAQPQAGFSTGDYEEAAIKRHIASQARQTIVPLTAGKLDRTSPFFIVPTGGVDGILLEDSVAKARGAAWRDAGLLVNGQGAD